MHGPRPAGRYGDLKAAVVCQDLGQRWLIPIFHHNCNWKYLLRVLLTRCYSRNQGIHLEPGVGVTFMRPAQKRGITIPYPFTRHEGLEVPKWGLGHGIEGRIRSSCTVHVYIGTPHTVCTLQRKGRHAHLKSTGVRLKPRRARASRPAVCGYRIPSHMRHCVDLTATATAATGWGWSGTPQSALQQSLARNGARTAERFVYFCRLHAGTSRI